MNGANYEGDEGTQRDATNQFFLCELLCPLWFVELEQLCLEK